MSCQGKTKAVAGTAQKNGIAPATSQNSGVQAPFFNQPTGGKHRNGSSKGITKKGQRSRAKRARRRERPPSSEPAKPSAKTVTPRPNQSRLKIDDAFAPAELQRLSVQFSLAEAAARKQLQTLASGVSRGIGHDDPRPADWAGSDRRWYHFLVQGLAGVRRGRAGLDTSGLSRAELIDLWQFARFEVDRNARQIDYFTTAGSGIGGPTAAYLTANHKLMGRFLNDLAGQLEGIIPPGELEAATAWETGGSA
jgi:hypothetical protein